MRVGTIAPDRGAEVLRNRFDAVLRFRRLQDDLDDDAHRI
jgi:hypothetical protein